MNNGFYEFSRGRQETTSSVFPYTGSAIITGSTTIIGSATITGSAFVTGSTTIIGSATITGSAAITGSAFITGSLQVAGITIINNILMVIQTATFPDIPKTGMIVVSGSGGGNEHIYCYLNNTWTQLDNAK